MDAFEAERNAEARAALERAAAADPMRLATRVGIEFDDNVTVPEIDASSGEWPV
jgi:hypothetical protein